MEPLSFYSLSKDVLNLIYNGGVALAKKVRERKTDDWRSDIANPRRLKLLRSYYSENDSSSWYHFKIGAVEGKVPFLSRPEWFGKDKYLLKHTKSSVARSRHHQSVLDIRERMGVRLTNDPLFTFTALQEETDSLTIFCSDCNYFDFVSECGLIEDELTANVSDPHHGYAIRDNLAKDLGTLLENPRSTVGMGVHTAVFFRRKGEWRMLRQTRSEETISWPNAFSTVPNFAFQAMFGREEEFDLQHNFLREYGEELFDFEELRGRDTRIEYDWFYHQPEIKNLVETLEKGGASFFQTGFGFDALNGEFNITSALVVSDEEAWTETIGDQQWSWESNDIDSLSIAEVVECIASNYKEMPFASVAAIDQGLKSISLDV